jgi:hypothetical protein
MLIHNKFLLGLGSLLLLGIIVLGQGTKDKPVGYTGVHWVIAPKGVDKNGKPFPPASALTVYEFRFDKAVAYGRGGCATTERSMWGNILRCPMTLPANVPGGIIQLRYRCEPPDSYGACGHTVECPGGVACSEASHLYPTTPDNLPVNKPRSLDWFGWTDDGNHATLIFDAYVQ